EQLYHRMKSLMSAARSEEELAKREMGVELAKATLARVKADFKLWELGAWQPDKDVAKAAVVQAKAQLQQTETELARLTVNAPHLRWKTGGGRGQGPEATRGGVKVLQTNIPAGGY